MMHLAVVTAFKSASGYYIVSFYRMGTHLYTDTPSVIHMLCSYLSLHLSGVVEPCWPADREP